MKHTPGPWTYYKTGDPIGSYRVGTNKRDGHDTCTVQSVLNESNAQLIATAPEMLDALKRLVYHVEHCEELGNIELAKAVIAKAEGK